MYYINRLKNQNEGIYPKNKGSVEGVNSINGVNSMGRKMENGYYKCYKPFK